MKEKRYITLNKQLKSWKTKNSYHDILKFQMIYRNKSAHITQETHDLKIESALKVYNDFPGVRFYGFHNSAKEFGVKNYYFDAQIIDDELYFDYTFKKGICQNMNASFLLKKMEIV